MIRRDFLKAGAGVVASLSAGRAFGALAGGIPFYISEYPTWALFLLAQRRGIMKKMEAKHGVRLDVQLKSYDGCLSAYGAKGGAVCITNTDIIAQVKNRPSTAILPTSTSNGADALLAVGVTSLQEIARKKIPVYGLDNSVSRYVFDRCCQKQGIDPKFFTWRGMDPEQVAQGIQAGQIPAGVVWNPFTIQTERSVKNCHRIVDSTLIPGEVIDMVCMDNATLSTPDGAKAAQCIVDTYYEGLKLLANPDQAESDDAYVALGEEFTMLNAKDMRLCLEQTHAYPAGEAVRTFGQRHIEAIMSTVVKWGIDRDIIPNEPRISYGQNNGNGQLLFDPRFVQSAAQG